MTVNVMFFSLVKESDEENIGNNKRSNESDEQPPNKKRRSRSNTSDEIREVSSII